MSVNYAAGLSDYKNKGVCGLPEQFDSPDDMERKNKLLAEIMQNSTCTVFHTGAGISTSCGIPDFRGPCGVWTLEQRNETPTFEMTFDAAEPSFTHMALVALEERGLLRAVVNQNVDGLNLRSGFPCDKLFDLHGNVFVQRCEFCRKQYVMPCSSPTMGLRLTGLKCCSLKRNRVRCRGKLRDTILDWEDALDEDELKMVESLCKKADVSICLGSSLQIVPAGSLPSLTKKNGGKLVIVNLQPTKYDKMADLRIFGYVDDVMRSLCDQMSVAVSSLSNPTTNLQSKLPRNDAHFSRRELLLWDDTGEK